MPTKALEIAVCGLLLSACDGPKNGTPNDSVERFNQLIVEIRDVEDVDRAVAACEALDKEATEDWLPELRQLLVDGEDFFIREAAAWPVARMDGAKSLLLLLQALKRGYEENHDNDGLQAAITDTVDAEPEAALPFVTQLSESQSAEDRQNAAWLLGYLHDHCSPDALLRLSNDGDSEVRVAAFGSLASFKDHEPVFERLLLGLQDPVPTVARSAASSLAYFGDRRALEPLTEFRDRVDDDYKVGIDYAIGQLK